jgi:tetratricopeptide (TPR) repeat protein
MWLKSKLAPKRVWQILAISLFCIVPIAASGQKEHLQTVQPLYYPSAVGILGEARQISADQLLGVITESERRSIREESRKTGFSRTILIGAKACVGCHQDVAAQWAVSAHRFSSFNNPFYTASVEDLRKKPRGITRSRWCAGCHDPALLLTGDFDADFDRDAPQAQAGLTCLICHSIRDVRGRPGNGNYVIAPDRLKSSDPLLKAKGKELINDPAAVALHKQNIITTKHSSAEFCGACHKASMPEEVNNYRWFRTQNDYDPWHSSSVSGNSAGRLSSLETRKTCQDCHMPKEEAVLGDLAAKNGLIRSHRFLAVNTALPTLRNDEKAIQRIEEFLAGRISADLFMIRRGEDFADYVPAPDVTLPTLSPGEEIQLDVVVRNRNVGHTFPGGTLDINEGWVELTLLGPGGEQLGISGDLKNNGTLDPGAHTYCALFLDGSGRRITNHNVADIRTLMWRHTIPFGEADLVRYRLRVPDKLAGKTLTLRARILWRKFNTPFRYFAYKVNRRAFPKGFPELPVIELAKSEVSLRVFSQPNNISLIDLGKAGPDLRSRFNDYGIAALSQQDFRTAEYAFSWLEKLAPEEIDGHLNFARTLIEQGSTAEGLQILAPLQSKAGKDSRVNWSVARAYYVRRDYQTAAMYLQEVVNQYPQDRQSWQMLAQSLAVAGDNAATLVALNRLLELDPANWWAHYLRARTLKLLNRDGEAEQAIAAYEKYREDFLANNRRSTYRRKSSIDDREYYPIHWHSVRYTSKVKNQ